MAKSDFQNGGLMDVSEYNKGNGKIRLRGRIGNLITIKQIDADGNHRTSAWCDYRSSNLLIHFIGQLLNTMKQAVKKKKIPIRNIDDFTSEN